MSREDHIRKDGLEEDKMFKTHKDLKFKWQWSRGGKPSTKRSQVCFSELYDRKENRLWKLKAVYWYDQFEAVVEYGGNHLVSKEGFKTRMEAQIGAEKLLFGWLTDEYTKIVKGEKQ